MNIPRGRKQLTVKNTVLAASIALMLVAALGLILWYALPASNTDRTLRYASTISVTDNSIGEPFGLVAVGNEIFVSDGLNGKVVRFKNGEKISEEGGMETPSGIAFGSGEYAFPLVVDTARNTIYKLDPSPTKIAGSDEVGNLDGAAISTARFNGPTGIAASADGKIYISDTYNDRIKVLHQNIVTTVAGSSRGFSDGIGVNAQFDTPTGLAIWKDKLLVADSGNRRIRVVEPDGRVWTLAGNGEADLTDGTLLTSSFVQPTALAVDKDGAIFVADGNAIRRIGGTTIPVVTTISSRSRGDSDGPTAKASFNRPSGLAFAPNGDLIVADSENQLIRRISSQPPDRQAINSGRSRQTIEEFRNAAPPRWPFDPPTAKRDIAGTLGEIRGEMTPTAENVWFHNGLDIAGAYGETARFIRDEKVLRPIAAENFGTLRELIRMPTLGYIHIRLGRSADGKPFGDPRFQFQTDTSGTLIDVRIRRGTKFKAGEPIGTLNPMNHVHLVAGRSGSEMNALDALILPGISDSRPPVIEKVTFYDQNWTPVETSAANSRIKLTGNIRIVAKAYDQMDGNPERRRLGVYKLGYSFTRKGEPPTEPKWTIVFDKMPSNDAVKIAYANESHSGATGETIFNYIVTNEVGGDATKEGYMDVAPLASGIYTLQVFAADYFGNIAKQEFEFEVIK